MDTIRIPQDFKEFLQLLNLHKVEYMLVGGFAVAYYGFPRATFDMDFLISFKNDNIEKIKKVLEEFGFGFPEIYRKEFWEYGKIIRMGLPPIRIELITKASGIEFEECFINHIEDELDGVKVNIISLNDLKKNKLAAGRYKDLNDLENLP